MMFGKLSSVQTRDAVQEKSELEVQTMQTYPEACLRPETVTPGGSADNAEVADKNLQTKQNVDCSSNGASKSGGSTGTVSNLKDHPADQLQATLNFLLQEGEAFEVCAIGSRRRQSSLWEGFTGGSPITGWFSDKAKAVDLALKLERESMADGVYVLLNPCNPALLGRANHKFKVSSLRTTDKDIVSLNTMMIDLDPTRPRGSAQVRRNSPWR